MKFSIFPNLTQRKFEERFERQLPFRVRSWSSLNFFELDRSSGFERQMNGMQKHRCGKVGSSADNSIYFHHFYNDTFTGTHTLTHTHILYMRARQCDALVSSTWTENWYITTSQRINKWNQIKWNNRKMCARRTAVVQFAYTYVGRWDLQYLFSSAKSHWCCPPPQHFSVR